MTDKKPESVWSTCWYSLGDCQSSATWLANSITEPVCIALSGTLGAGKTQFVRYFVEAFGGDASQVSSPTFVLVNLYQARLPVAHLDLYRLNSMAELDSIGFDDLVYGEAVCLIEWSNKFPDAIPSNALWIDIEPKDQFRTVHCRAESDSIAGQIVEGLKLRMSL